MRHCGFLKIYTIFYVEMDSGSCVLACSVRTKMVASSLLASNAYVTLGVKCIPSRGNVGSSGHTLLSVYRVRHGNYSTFRGFMQLPCSLRLWKTPGFRHHGRYGLGRVDVSVCSAMLGFRLYMLCVILRSSTTVLYAELHVFLREGGSQISVRSSHLGAGHYFYSPLFLLVNSSVLLLREECNQEDKLGVDFRIFPTQPLAWFNSASTLPSGSMR